MSKNVAMFVDVANLYYSARGQDVDVDYVALLKYATKGRDLIRAYAYSGLDPENENQRKFIDFLGKHGYKVVHKDIRKFGDGRVKANLDIELVVDLFRLADRMDIAVIVSGDGDFAPAIRALQDGGVRCEVISFRPNTSSDLIAVADEFFDIMKIASIERGKEARTGMPAPEMPAKEVSPEFGFREAPPGVAAAALAALRDGPSRSGGGARRGRGGQTSETRRVAARGEAAPPPLEPVALEVQAALPESTGDEDAPRRRRRRRGGRGRGRRREAEATETPTLTAGAALSGELDLPEADDNDLVGVGEDREYTFEEADAATLAELGLSALTPDELAPVAAEPGGAEPQTTVRRTRQPRRAASGTTEPAQSETRPRGRRRTSSTAGEAGAAGRVERATSAAEPGGDGDAPAEAPAEAKPARRRRTAKAAAGPAASGGAGDGGAIAADAEGASGGEPEGIWKRFRSGRRTAS